MNIHSLPRLQSAVAMQMIILNKVTLVKNNSDAIIIISAGHTTNIFRISTAIRLKVAVWMDNYAQLFTHLFLWARQPRCRFMTDMFELVRFKSRKLLFLNAS